MIYDFCPSALFFFRILLSRRTTILHRIHPTIQPNALWIISSHSNSPRRKISWLISIQADTQIPARNACQGWTFFFTINGSNTPIGINNIQFSKSSCNKDWSWWLITSNQDQNGISSYCLVPTALTLDVISKQKLYTLRVISNPIQSSISPCA